MSKTTIYDSDMDDSMIEIESPKNIEKFGNKKKKKSSKDKSKGKHKHDKFFDDFD